MGLFFKGMFGWFLVTLLLVAEPALAGRSFVIEKSDSQTSGVPLKCKVFDDNLTRTTCLSRDWGKPSQLESFFPPQGAPYEIVLDLSLFSAGTLPNINNFLIALSGKSEISQRTPALSIINGTSHKFNLLFPGIKAYFENTPGAKVSYHQGGTQTPLAAQTKLANLGPLKEMETPLPPSISQWPSLIHVNNLGGPEPKADQIKIKDPSRVEERETPLSPPILSQERVREWLSHLDLSNPGEPENISEVMDEDCSQITLFSMRTEAPVMTLERAVEYGESRDKEDRLKARWADLEGGSWPPLGITKKEEMISIDSEKVVSVFGEELGSTPQPIVLEIAGAFPGSVRRVIDVCRRTPSIKCLIIRDSLCVSDDFKGLHVEGSIPNDEDSALLGEDKIRFVDVQSAFSEDRITDLQSFFERKGMEKSLDYFVQFPSYDFENTEFKQLNTAAQTTHKLFWVLSDYLESLESQTEGKP